ncbi:Predicted metal-dependent phosphohydrolase, HD superfamily [Chryseobacterium taichungense]|uniref:Predicted metal-dependent phosphohydrolase, HD superfamily n=1 Tax=Chryseobacterium taichungense TaxID=295069 RepID=A0A1H7YDP5_9FLAO|nr:hypothetical protein [Chryseobacterium taichungense]SEM43299.1 Predicted metal-dependent phosphohydrolase, HD superfamily [Chryseobacterium taichungense]
MDLQERFSRNCIQISENIKLINDLWLEIEKKYSEKGRHYHNFEHLQNMFIELSEVTPTITDLTAITFSVFYHDVIYNVSSKTNEEKSAEFARKHLRKLCTDTDLAEKVSQQIIATKLHVSEDSDTNYLLDADLSVLGQKSEKYIEYTQKIRKEYSIYPDLLYKPGRKKVLHHFLESESIFKTNYFREKYEDQARKNILLEIESLNFG